MGVTGKGVGRAEAACGGKLLGAVESMECDQNCNDYRDHSC